MPSSESEPDNYATPPHDNEFLLAETEKVVLSQNSDEDDALEQPLFSDPSASASASAAATRATAPDATKPNPMNIVCLFRRGAGGYDSDSEDEDVTFGSQLASLLGVGRRPTNHLEDRRRAAGTPAATHTAAAASTGDGAGARNPTPAAAGRDAPSPSYASSRKRTRSDAASQEEVKKIVEETLREIAALERVSKRNRADIEEIPV